ncbi:alpha/beta fold hydrolase [Phenylobacterium sp.]|jgi:pimeloyl-ACP methyl ester carboxylesterase/DNA-binding CsgD family transcriptional regulator|uniref:alpha/beta fold hydrolase n=1 Tax=Phenylobacterium sp. TaxID=1871053 RepID=UPI002E31139E|nr:alpha/beta fold hydrolase [Phenylobacterium sp.]HEX2561208.1 alpha/beta fold hydrolase [Phenylobacterium sp.]
MQGGARLLVETLYQVAADPECWEQLIEALEGAADEPPAPVAAELGRIHGLAQMVRRQGEGPAQRGEARPEMGWLLLSPRRTVLACNPAARAALEPDLAQVRAGAHIGFVDPANAEALEAALADARRSGRQTILRLEREAGSAPAFAYVASPSVLEDGPASAEPGAFALVFPSPDPAERLWSSIRESFGLTPAELRLARKLRDGLTLSDAAQDLNVSVNTVRNQLRAIFDKMGLKRQADLVRALTELAALAGALSSARPAGDDETPPIRHIRLGDGRRLAYREYGCPDGRAVLAFHEGMGSCLLPAETSRMARELGLRLVCADRPGFGQSDRRADYGFGAVAEDMVQLCDRLGLQHVVLSGLLSGAPSALATAIRLGDRARLVMVCSGRPPRITRARGPLGEFRARLESHPWVVESFFAILRLRLSPGLVQRLMRRSSEFSDGDRAWFDANPWVAEYVTAYVGECLAHGARGIADEIGAFRRSGNMSLAGLSAPVAVFHGAEDTFNPLSDMLDYLGERASEVTVFDAVGHLAAARHWRQLLERAAG